MYGISGLAGIGFNTESYDEIVYRMSTKLCPPGRNKKNCRSLLSDKAVFSICQMRDSDELSFVKAGSSEYLVAFSGYLTNNLMLYRELAKDFSVNAHDSAKLAALAFHKWKENSFKMLNGAFSMAILDINENEGYIVRDQLGIMPLYYMELPEKIVFSSEIKGLFEYPECNAIVKTKGLMELLALGPNVTPGKVIFEGIEELEAGTYIKFNLYESSFKTIISKYWQIAAMQHKDSFRNTIDIISDMIFSSVEGHLEDRTPFCCFLSGGLDSSGLSAIIRSMSRNIRSLCTFSVDYNENYKYFKSNSFQPNTDTMFIKLMAEELKSYHRYVTIDSRQLAEALKKSMIARDLPGMADIDSSLLLFSGEVGKIFTSAFSGECADEIFGGYPWFFNSELALCNTYPWAKTMKVKTDCFNVRELGLPDPTAYAAEEYEKAIREAPYSETFEYENLLESIDLNDILDIYPYSPSGTDQYNNIKEGEEKIRKLSYINLTRFMPVLRDRSHRMGTYNGVDIKMPFADHRLIQYAYNIPWFFKAYKGREKGLLREAFTKYLPSHIVERKKSPYPKTHHPDYELLVKELLKTAITDTSSKLKPLLDTEYVNTLLEAEGDVSKPWFGQLMAAPQLLAYLYQFELWLREYNVTLMI